VVTGGPGRSFFFSPLFRVSVIAEGMDTEEQMTFLQAHGCDEEQGHYFSKPNVAHQFAKLLETGKAAFASHACVSVPV
jgi:sensor c-di-GMP phosphodiesterase-like protein